MKKQRVTGSMFSVWNYLLFFAIIAVIVTCSLFVFAHNLDVDFYVDVRRSAMLTLINTLVLSLIFTLIDGIRRKITVERPIKRILVAAEKITEGDFTARVEPLRSGASLNEFDAIISHFNKMAEELSGIETLRSDFISNVSHELKTPLSVIQNYATMLQDPDLPKETRLEYAKTITAAAGRLTELITNILKLNKLENQQIFPETRAYNLGEQMRECLLAFEDAWEKKDLELDIDIEEIRIKADEELMTVVWNNLFSNAVKFSEPGGKISVSLKKDGEYTVAAVSDTGGGMTDEVKRNIFEKFYQGDKSRATQGNGLGLALVKRVLDITGGEISVKSEEGKGSVFTVRLKGDG